MKKVICEECDWHGLENEVLQAPNPFDPEDGVLGCPKCKSVNEIVYTCIADNCWKPVSCGTPTVGGYMNTCGKHAPR
jgi:hypothetical protein